MQTLSQCLKRLDEMVDSSIANRLKGNNCSSQSKRIINSYGQAIKDRFENKQVSNHVDNLLLIVNSDGVHLNNDITRGIDLKNGEEAK